MGSSSPETYSTCGTGIGDLRNDTPYHNYSEMFMIHFSAEFTYNFLIIIIRSNKLWIYNKMKECLDVKALIV